LKNSQERIARGRKGMRPTLIDALLAVGETAIGAATVHVGPGGGDAVPALSPGADWIAAMLLPARWLLLLKPSRL